EDELRLRRDELAREDQVDLARQGSVLGCGRADDGAGCDRSDGLLAHGAELEARGGERGDRLVEAHADDGRHGAELLAMWAAVAGCVELHEREDAAVAGGERSHLRLELAGAEGTVELTVDVEEHVAELAARVGAGDPA